MTRTDAERLDWLERTEETGFYRPTVGAPVWIVVTPDTRPEAEREVVTMMGETAWWACRSFVGPTLRDALDAAMDGAA